MSPRTHSGCFRRWRPADIAQLVERNLAKVEVAGSSPVVRSKASCLHQGPTAFGEGMNPSRWSGREARQRPAKPSTRVQIPSPPRSTHTKWAVGAAVARFPDTEEVAGSIPVPPTSTKWPLTCGNADRGSSLSPQRAGYVQDGSTFETGSGRSGPGNS